MGSSSSKDHLECLLGAETDTALLGKLLEVLEDLGGVRRQGEVLLGGSQELTIIVFGFEEGEVVVEVETYMGIKVSGSRALVERVREALGF